MCSTWAEEPFSTKTPPFQIGLGLGRSFENYVLPSFCPETIHLSIVSTSGQVVLKSFVKETFKTARSSVQVYKKHKNWIINLLKTFFLLNFSKKVPCKVHDQNVKKSLAMIFSLLKMWNKSHDFCSDFKNGVCLYYLVQCAHGDVWVNHPFEVNHLSSV